MEVRAVNYSTGFLWDLGEVALHLQDPSPQLFLLPSLETGSETPGLVGTVTQGHPTSSSCDSGLGTSPCTAASAAPWGCSSQGTSQGTSGQRAPLLAACWELGSCCVPAPETLTVVRMGDVGQAPQPLHFLPAQTSARPTPAPGRFTEQQ